MDPGGTFMWAHNDLTPVLTPVSLVLNRHGQHSQEVDP